MKEHILDASSAHSNLPPVDWAVYLNETSKIEIGMIRLKF
jgi:hypothetical protein